MRTARRIRRGMALMLVLVVIAAAAVMGSAILSGAAMQAQASSNAACGAQARGLAESGLSVACYYLQNPQLAPGNRDPEGWWRGGEVNLGGSLGVVGITVEREDFDTFSVISSASSGGLHADAAARVEVVRGIYPINRAAGFNTNVLIPRNFRITGGIAAYGLVFFSIGSTVSGILDVGWLWSIPFGCTRGTAPSGPVAPTLADINGFATYRYGEGRFTAKRLSGAILSSTTLNPTADNPAGIYYWDGGDMSINSNVTLNGTLLITNGKLDLKGTNNTITAPAGFPALLIARDLNVYGGSRGLTVNGLVWIGGGFGRTGSANGSVLNINGAFYFGETGNLDSGFDGVVNVTFNAAKTQVRNLSSSQPIESVRILEWLPSGR